MLNSDLERSQGPNASHYQLEPIRAEATRSPEEITILLAEDHDITRLGLKVGLQKFPNFKIIGEAKDGITAVRMAAELLPSIVLMDIGLPGMDGIEATWQIKTASPQVRVIIFTSHDTSNDVLGAIGASADGYCLKDTSAASLAEAIRSVVNGNHWIDPRMANRASNPKATILENAKTAAVLSPDDFSNLRSEVFQLLGKDVNSDQKRALAPDCVAIGEVFADRYEIDSVVGTGGMGTVFKARHILMDRTVAIKVLHPHLVTNEKLRKRFQQEARAASTLQHPNVISVFDFGVTPRGLPYLVMDYAEGESLDQILQQLNFLPLDRMLKVFVQTCNALVAAHQKNIAHCDLKPSNLMLVNQDGDKEIAKLVDFGISKICEPQTTKQQQVTDCMEVTGSPCYMSPEQCIGRPLDSRTDIYSLGCMMYESLMGVPPFIGESAYEIFAKHLHEQPKPFNVLRPRIKIPAQLETLILSCLEKDPNNRPQSVQGIRSGLIEIAYGLAH